jgi:hypothetical protein
MTIRQAAIDNARRVAAEAMQAKGEVQPMIIAHAGGALVAYPLGEAMESVVLKDIAARRIGADMRRRGVTLYVFVSEAWLADVRGEADPDLGTPPSERSDRIEVLLISASDLEGDTVATYRIVRNARGRFQRFDLLENTDLDPAMSSKGRFLGLLR